MQINNAEPSAVPVNLKKKMLWNFNWKYVFVARDLLICESMEPSSTGSMVKVTYHHGHLPICERKYAHKI